MCYIIHHFMLVWGIRTGNSILAYRLSVHEEPLPVLIDAHHPEMLDLEQDAGPRWDFGVVSLGE